MGKGSGECHAGRPSIMVGGAAAVAAEAIGVVDEENSYENPLPASAGPTTLENTTLDDDHPAVIDAQRYPKRHNSKQLNYSLVETPEAMDEMLAALSHPGVERIALDIETTGAFVPWDGSIRLIQIGIEEPEPRQFVIDVWKTDPTRLFPHLTNHTQEIVMCGGRYEQLHMLYRYGIEIDNVYDVTYASQAITKTRGRKVRDNFKALMLRYTGKRISKEEQNSGWNQPELSLNQYRYAAMDVAGLLDIRRQIGLDVAQRGLDSAARSRFYSIISSAQKSVSTNGRSRHDQVIRMTRAIEYAATAEEAAHYRSFAPRLPITYAQEQELEAVYQARLLSLQQ
jgi:hypothetical protein